MPQSFRFADAIRMEDRIQFATSIAFDGAAASIMFSDFALHKTKPNDPPLQTKFATFNLPIKSDQPLIVSLAVVGQVALDDGLRGALMVHQAGQTALFDLTASASPMQQISAEFQEINQILTGRIPAGSDYRITLFLLLERFDATNDATGSVQLDLLDIELQAA